MILRLRSRIRVPFFYIVPLVLGLVSLVPYTIALVRIDEQDDILIPGRLVSDVEVRQGLRVRAVPRKLTDDVGEVLWEADETAT